MALTRRVATGRFQKQGYDASLVRHLYDLYQIEIGGHFSAEFQCLVWDIVEADRIQYRRHNSDYYENPPAEIQRSVEELRTSTLWRTHWERFVEVMVFSDVKPSYDVVLANLENKTAVAISALPMPYQNVGEGVSVH